MNLPLPIAKASFRVASLAESLAFRASRLLAAPAWGKFILIRPNPQPLGYAELLHLASKYRPVPKSSAETRQRGQVKWANRAARLAKIYGAGKVLEVGCGAGVATVHLMNLGFQSFGTDILPHLDPAVKEKGIRFAMADACGWLPYPCNCFDLVFSINAFEHFEDPAAALGEILRVLKPGGILFLSFDPLYYSTWGLHAFRRLGMPYPQLLFSDETIQQFFDERREELAGTFDEMSDKTKISPFLNRYSLHQFRKILSAYRQRLKLLTYIERVDLSGIKFILEYAGQFKAVSPSFEDLIVTGIKLVAVKKPL